MYNDIIQLLTHMLIKDVGLFIIHFYIVLGR